MINKTTSFVSNSKYVYLLTFTYFAGLFAHLMRLITQKPPSTFVPRWFDALLFVLATYGTVILAVVFLSNRIKFTKLGFGIYYGVMLFHTLITIPIHLTILIKNDNTGLDQTPMWYSWLVMIWFSVNGYFSYTIMGKIMDI